MDILCVFTEAKRFGTAGQPFSTRRTWKKVCRVGWCVGVGGGDGGGPNSSPSMCCSHYILTHIFSPDWWKSLHLCLTWMSARWVCGWISNSVFGKWKHVFWIKKMDTMNPGHVGRGGGWSVSVTVRQCTPVLPTHLYRVAVNSGNPQGHGTKGDWDMTHSSTYRQLIYW